MADQADVYVNNLSNKGEVIVQRNNSPDSSICQGDVMGFLAFLKGEILTITPPVGVDENSVKYQSMIDLDLVCSRTNSNWVVKIKENNLPQDAPTTVNVTIGDN